MGLKENPDPQSKYEAKKMKRLPSVAIAVLSLATTIAVPFSVQAGVFKPLTALLGESLIIYERAQPKGSVVDLALLSATANSDPTGAIGGGDLIVEEGFLVSTGTLGEDEMYESKSFAGEISVYIVRPGDTLSQIADMFDVTANTILWANDIKSGVIQPGDSLVILPIAGVRHVVKSGDTLNSIAKKYDAKIDEIVEYNQLNTDDQLSLGSTVVVPGGQIAAPVSVAKKPSGGAATTANTGGSSAGFSHPAPGAVRTQGVHGYNGVDLAGRHGSSIKAAAAGEVIVSKGSGWNGGYGNYIVIKHPNGTQTLYAHLNSNYVGVGDYVAAGEVIGTMGSTGRSTGNHLHFEVRGARNPF
jgi:LysM repeat protein